eukprot:CAMPEP_0184693920 /NCGR_PEP_ID=MMETSP0313-20130426/2020_1 /TAXON_ID=2792 /ORGANISM="Porphyridium aerugineum, Strain SAG 1380-2" /LENGTH=192 /DNA_ID=CAMNT_0027152099 /DNA_START=128 /DNA_END=706 /DNA_ORIENTATION=-
MESKIHSATSAQLQMGYIQIPSTQLTSQLQSKASTCTYATTTHIVGARYHHVNTKPINNRRCTLISMADINKSKPNIGGGKFEQDTGKGGVVTIQKPEVKKQSKKEEETDKEPNWRVLLHNDDVHTFDYVTGSIVKVVKTVSRRKAHRITMQAHSHGIATVTTTWKALAEEYCKGLQMCGLTSSIAPDSSFK